MMRDRVVQIRLSHKFKDRNARPSSKSERRFGERSNGTERTEIRTGQFKSFDRQRSTDGRAEPSTRRDNNFSRMKSSNSNDDQVPVSIPYTTAASVFLYGANPVLAALRGKQRKAYSLLLTSRASNNPTIREILDHAKTLGIKVNEDASPRLLDKMTTAGTESGEPRPHNGVVLEASKLPAPPVLALSVPNKETRRVQLTLDSQSPEERSINGDRSSLRFPSHRQPFVLFVDGITDPGNLGNIIRTAHFYGVDAVAVATNTCAPLTSAVLAKASAGACEAVPIMSLPKPANFIFDSRKAGWQIYAAAPAPTSPATNSRSRADPNAAQKLTTASLQKEKPLVEQPCILMLGAEGEGLRSNLTVKADYFLSIEQGLRESRSVDVGVESLNVSVAAGVLIEALMRQTELTGAQLFRQTQEEKMF
ncbi:Hypothetical protein R9X50_00433000 [Acrodontium crateriforme]|uniref:rRNA methyltransferase 1, mitochondrial n=1 Tax=Acrodontium crateriforme TaxID=150365 RepID=A0AAQ3R8B4_9PEZI|nr:Hypothetical protein R9X50_00433000 [Acrodontium crateriforme]